MLRHIIKATTPATRALAVSTRALATQPSALHVFDQATKHAQRERANAPQHADQSRVVDYLRDEVAERMVDRLLV